MSVAVGEVYATWVVLHPLAGQVRTTRQLREEAQLASPGVASPDLSASEREVLMAVADEAREVKVFLPVYLVEGVTGGNTYYEPQRVLLTVAGGSRLSIASTSTPIGFETVVEVWNSDGQLVSAATVNTTVPLPTYYAAVSGGPFDGASPAPPPDGAPSVAANDTQDRLQAEQREALLNLLVTLVTGADNRKGLLGMLEVMVPPLVPLADVALGW